MRHLFISIALLVLAGQYTFGQLKPADFYRPQYHFTAPKNWINDPNGLIYYNGEYHLFYQHNPFANVWGHMSWGHAVSNDLLHWQPRSLAIPEFAHPDGKPGQQTVQTAIFSGSTVVDRGNASGVCPAGTKDCMVAIYTGNVTQGDRQTAQYQNLAYSADKGQTWTQYAKNPIIDIGSKEFRDPNVFWYAPQKKWVMATVKATEHRAAFYESSDLKNWQLMSHFGPAGDTTKVWECPALMQVPVRNGAGRTTGDKSKWVLFISAGHPQKDYVGMQYFVGNFDGTAFKPDPASPAPNTLPIGDGYAGAVVDYGKDYYAAIPFNDLPAGAGSAPVAVGWLNNWAYANDLPTTPFKGAYSLPRQLTLKRTGAGWQLVQQPISAAMSLRGVKREHKAMRITNQSLTLEKSLPNTYELVADIRPGTAKSVGIRLAKNSDEETIIRYTDGKLQLDRRKSGNVTFNHRFPSVEEAPLRPENGVIKLRIFVDRSVVEVYANDGERVITDLIFPTESAGSIELFAEGGTAEFNRITLWPMKSARP